MNLFFLGVWAMAHDTGRRFGAFTTLLVSCIYLIDVCTCWYYKMIRRRSRSALS